MNVRIRTDLSNPETRDIIKFFNDVLKILTPRDRCKVEFLIKFDSDDSKARNVIDKLSQLPLVIRTFIYRRWEGMDTAYHNYTYSLCRADSHSKFIGFCGDDSIPLNLNVNTLEYFKDNDYIFFTSMPRMLEEEWLKRANYKFPFKSCMESLNNMRLVDPYPILSRKLLEICSGVGFCTNIDGWLALLNVILFNKYGISIIKNLPSLMFYRDNTQSKDMIEDSFTSTFNRDMEDLPYYFNLINQQAKNIYLNINHE